MVELISNLTTHPSVISFINKAYAVSPTVNVQINNNNDGTFVGYTSELIKFGVNTLGPIAGTIMFAVAGIIYFMSGGDESRVKLAKELAIGVITGYALLLMMKTILDFLSS